MGRGVVEPSKIMISAPFIEKCNGKEMSSNPDFNEVKA